MNIYSKHSIYGRGRGGDQMLWLQVCITGSCLVTRVVRSADLCESIYGASAFFAGNGVYTGYNG